MTTAYEIDDATLLPQPDDHHWEPEKDGVIGHDGDGAPVKKKYRYCVLRSNHASAYQAWSQFDDGSTHTVTIPAPDTVDDWTDYTTCYVVVSHGRVANAKAFEGIEMLVTMAQAY